MKKLFAALLCLVFAAAITFAQTGKTTDMKGKAKDKSADMKDKTKDKAADMKDKAKDKAADAKVGKTKDGKDIFMGPKGGKYYLNDKGKKVYVKDANVAK